jgi:ligand-binding sensor domain-containing protein
MAQHPAWLNHTNGDKVTDILNDGDHLWIATTGGLVKFHKTSGEKTFYNRANANLPDNFPRSLAKDKDGSIWVASQYYGIGRLHGGRCYIFHSRNSGIPSDQWNSKVAIDGQGNKWFGSLGKLAKFDGSEWQSWQVANPISTYQSINSIIIRSNGNHWLGGSWGLGRFTGFDVKYFSEVTTEVHCLSLDTQGNMWIGTNGLGLVRYDGVNFTVHSTTNSDIPSNIVLCVKPDAQGNVWCGMATGELVRFNGTTFQTYTHTLLHGGVSRIELDSDGTLWLGTLLNGLVKRSGGNYSQVNLSNSPLPTNTIMDMALGPQGEVWLATRHNLIKIDGQTWASSYMPGIYTMLTDPNGNLWVTPKWSDTLLMRIGEDGVQVFDSLNSPLRRRGTISSMVMDAHGTLWVGTYGKILRYVSGNWDVFSIENTPLTSNWVTDLALDAKGNLWGGLGTYYDYDNHMTKPGGLFHFDGTNWNLYNKWNSGLPSNFIGTLTFDSNNILWLSARHEGAIVGREYGEGLTRFDGTTWTTYNMGNSAIPSNSLLDIHVDGSDNIWMGTVGGGLAKFDGNTTWKIYDVLNSGLAYNSISKVLIDSNKSIWLSHLNGNGISVADLSLIDEPTSAASTLKVRGNITVYPNPAHEYINLIPHSMNSSPMHVSTYDLTGRLICSHSLPANQGEYRLSLAELNIVSNGLYIIRVVADKESYSTRLMVLGFGK